MSKPRKSLPRKLGLTLMLLASPLFVVSLGTFFNHVQEILHQEVLEHSNSILNTTMQRVVNHMNTIETAAKANAWLLEENFTPDSLQSISRRLVKLNSSVLSCSVSTEPGVFPERGRYFSVYSVNEGDTIITVLESDFEYFERAWYQTALKMGKACWVDPFSDFNEGAINFSDAVASFCIPLRPEKGKISGVISADFSFNRLAETVLASEHPFPTAYYMLLGTDGRYLIHPESKLLFKKTIFSDTDSLQNPDVMALGHEMITGKRGVMHVTKDDNYYHVCYAPVPGTQWSLALVCLDDEVLADYYHLTYLIIIVVIVGLLLIMWITARVVRQNINPINYLLGATQKIVDGNYDEVIPTSDGKDFVSQLQNTFAAMQQSIISHKENVDRMTEEIRKENEEVERAMQQARESAEEKQQFIRNILRQIHTPLNVIEGLTNVLLGSLSSRSNNKKSQKPLNTEEIQNITVTMKQNATRVNRMALMLFDSSESVASDEAFYKRNEDVPCNKVALECIEYTRVNYPDAEVRFETELPDSLCIRSSYLYLMRSIREVLYNSAKYSDGKHIMFRILQTESTVRFVVEDVGPGLSKELQDIFFMPFTKADQQSIGLGLGLPLTKRHIQGLGGEFIYDSDYQQGCRIIIEMPK